MTKIMVAIEIMTVICNPSWSSLFSSGLGDEFTVSKEVKKQFSFQFFAVVLLIGVFKDANTTNKYYLV